MYAYIYIHTYIYIYKHIHVEQQVCDSDQDACVGRPRNLARQERDERLESLLVTAVERDAQPVALDQLLDYAHNHFGSAWRVKGLSG